MLTKKISDKIPWNFIILFGIFTIVFTMIGYFYYTSQKQNIRQNKSDELYNIANLKLDLIGTWLKHRKQEARVNFENPFIVDAINEYLSQPKNKKIEKSILNYFNMIKKEYKEYSSIFLINNENKILFNITDYSPELGKHAIDQLDTTKKYNTILLSDLHKITDSSSIHLDLTVPVKKNNSIDQKLIAILMIRINPFVSLYNFVQSIEVQTKSTEALIVHREDNNIVFLNNVRYLSNSALNLKIPLTNTKVPSVMSVFGKKGIVEGLDYRGVKVLAYITKIPDSPWYLTVKIDEEEIFEVLYITARNTFIIIFILMCITALVLGLFWRHGRAKFYRKLYEKEVERTALKIHYEYLTKYANDIILLLDEDTNIIEANNKALESYGYTKEEIEKLKISNIRFYSEEIKIQNQLKQAESEHGVVFETLHKRKDGRSLPVEVSSRVIRIEGKKFYQSIIRDISERKKYELDLKESEEKHRKLFEEAIDAIFIADVETGILIECNQAASQLLNMEKAEIIGKHQSFMHPKDNLEDGFTKEFKQHINEFHDKVLETKMVTKDKIIKTVAVKSHKLELNGRTILQGIFRDITDAKRAEAEQLRLQNLESLGILAGGIAHDFNNILTAILGRVSLALHWIIDDKIKNELINIEKATKRAVGLSNQLLTFAKGGQPQKSTIDISKLIQETTKFSLSGSNVISEFQFNHSSILEADYGQIAQVIQNIVINAKQSMPKGGKISISTYDITLNNNDNYLKIIIRDTGVGIEKEILDKIFDPYFTTKSEGSGLGLSVCHSIIHKHGGRLHVESEVSYGTNFFIILPANIKVNVQNSDEIVNEFKNLNILIMDDDHDIRELLESMIISTDNRVQSSKNGLEAINLFKKAKFENDPFDILIMDLTVKGGMGGIESAKYILEFDPGAKIIVSSGYADNAISNFKNHGFCGILNKPYTLEELKKVIAEIISN